MDLGLLVGRVVFGLALAAHGSQKLFGWFGGYGIAGTGGFLAQLGFRPGRLFAIALGSGELLSGVLTAFGLFGPVGPALMITLMLVAMIVVHWPHGFFAATNGIELALLFATAGLTLATAGPGRYSLDAALGLSQLWTPEATWLVVGISVLAALVNLVVRRPAPTVA